jgi:asparagine synthase (glutamine-hydrolysing)
MCGIAGAYNPSGLDIEEVISLSQTLKHRGPDDEGFFLTNQQGFSESFRGVDTINELNQLRHISENGNSSSLALVHRRLSILDVSELGHQPFLSKNGRYCIVFNGEVYNFKEIRKELEVKGYTFKSGTDTEVVLQAFIEWGKNCVTRFVGMWAFAIYDNQSSILTLSRDRFGIKPLYFYLGERCFVFASEIKALLKAKDVDKTVSQENLGSYLSFGTTASPYQNLFEHIKDLEPGCNYEYNLKNHQLSKEPYFSIDKKVDLNSNSLKENTQKFEELFHAAISLHLRSDVEIGSCLSGGLDSSAIVYEASKQLGKTSLKTFTAAYQNPLIDESSFAKTVVNALDNVNDIYTYPDAKTMINDMDKLMYHQDLPIGSTSIFAQWEVMKCANQHNVKVLLDGQGADEVLGGYTNFGGIYLIELLKNLRFNKFLKEYKRLKQNFSPQVKNAVLKAAYYYLPTLLQKQLRAKERLSYNFINDNIAKELRLDVPNRGGKTFEAHSQLSVKFGMYDLLRYEDRNSMAFSIESRVPFLYHRLVDFIRSLPNDQKIYNGWAKFVLRQLLNEKLDDKVVWRKDKKGFVTPQKEWKNELMNSLTSELKDSDMPSLMNREYVLKLCDKDLSNASHLSEFWRAYSVVKWYNTFNLKA